MHYLLLIAWLFSVVYATIPPFWFVIHPFPDFWRRLRSPLNILGPMWVLLWVILGAATWPWRYHQLYSPHLVSTIVGLALLVYGFNTYRRARSFGFAAVTGKQQLEPQRHQQTLRTEGIHGEVRHPIYRGHLVNLLGWAVLSAGTVPLILSAISLITYAALIYFEDRELEARFGDSFREYRNRVPALFPAMRR